MADKKRAQIASEVFKYVLIAVFSVVIFVGGYKMINVVKDRSCSTEITKFEIDLKSLDKNVRYGEKVLQSYNAPCSVDKIYFFDLGKNINPDYFNNVPIIKDSLANKGNKNVFLVKNGNVLRSFYAGNIEMVYPYHLCFVPKFDRISFFAEGSGKSAKITSSCDQPECTFIPSSVSLDDARQIISEGINGPCQSCQNDLDNNRITLTSQNVEVLRKFVFCENLTEVEVTLNPRRGANLRDFRFYEVIPKTCVNDLNAYLAENLPNGVITKNDPMMIWHFDSINKETKFSYKVSINLDDDCRKLIKGMGVAQSIQGAQTIAEAANSASQTQETQNAQQPSQQNAQIPSSSAATPEHQASQPQSTNHESDADSSRDSSQCRPNAGKRCEDNKVYWFDSCGRRGQIYYDCGQNIARRQCRNNNQCCIGSFFCSTP